MTITNLQLEEGFRADIALAAIHDVDDGKHQVLVAFPHNKLDTYRTDWAPGCWDESFADRLPAMVWNHNPDQIIGRGVAAQTMPDRTELRGQYADFDAVPKAREAWALERDKMIPGWSFHFREGQSIEHPTIRNARRFTKARMLEFSPVTFPSIPGAAAVGLRAEEANQLTPTISELRALVADGSITEDGFRALVAQHYPDLREHIHVQPPAPAPGNGNGPALSVSDIMALHEKGLTDDAGMRAMLAKHHPEIADHLTKTWPPFDEAALEAVREQVRAQYGDDAARAISMADQNFQEAENAGETRCPTCKGMGHMLDGTKPSVTGPLCPTCDGKGWVSSRNSDDAADLAAAIDAALDAANELLAQVPNDGLREDVSQAMALVQAAGVAADELLEVMGIEDVAGERDTKAVKLTKSGTKAVKDENDDDDDAEAESEPDSDDDEEERPFKGAHAPFKKSTGKRKMIGSKERNDLPDSAFAYIEPGGEKDSEGKTTPRSLRHFIITDAAHVRNALARIGQGAKFSDEAMPKVKEAAKKFGVDIGDNSRSAEEDLAAFFEKRAAAKV